MEFLVEIEVRWPADGDPQRKAALIAAEAQRAGELAASGRLRRLWRVPGRLANVGLWDAADASELHEALASLPFYPWLDIAVRPLAAHPSDPGKPRAERS
jgi:muconolactone D-isomerase